MWMENRPKRRQDLSWRRFLYGFLKTALLVMCKSKRRQFE